jgi:hypothetical protein
MAKISVGYCGRQLGWCAMLNDDPNLFTAGWEKRCVAITAILMKFGDKLGIELDTNSPEFQGIGSIAALKILFDDCNAVMDEAQK